MSHEYDPLQATAPVETVRLGGREAAAAGQAYLVVFEGERSRTFQLPPVGPVLIGRAEGVDLRLDDAAVSRQHARIAIEDGQARLADLDSQNGTFVNGERVIGERPLQPGETVTIGGAALVYCAPVRGPGRRSALEVPAFRARLEEETERALGFQRPLAVLAVAFDGAADRPRVDQLLGQFLRRIDAWAWSSASEAVALLPETDPGAAATVARSVVEVLARGGARARVGHATCPTDGCDADTLLIGARAAGGHAAPGSALGADEAFRTITVGSVTVLVADPAMVRLYALAERLAGSTLPVLVCGETGSGKEVLASALHHWSPRAKGPLQTLNCAALQDTLVESELFGYERGAFTGAVTARAGLLERADGGTVFLDEIGELSPAAQAKLLRVLETQRVLRLGDSRERQVDLRVVAATNRSLEQEVAAGRFRQDLLYRLNAATLWLPPLRERRREIPLLAQAFLRRACATRGPLAISDAAMELLATHAWPGNVRELRNAMEFLAATVVEDMVEPWHLRDRLAASAPPAPPQAATPAALRSVGDELRDHERRRMQAALAETGGNQTRAAERIGMPLRTFVRKLKQYGLA